LNSERWHQIAEIFQAAVEMAARSRNAGRSWACGEDAELRSEVESLLAMGSGPDTLLTTVISAAARSISVERNDDLIGRRIGAYKVTGYIGEGGMAEVVRAVRDDDEY
jgi:hypothetical protein